MEGYLTFVLLYTRRIVCEAVLTNSLYLSDVFVLHNATMLP